MMETPQQMLYEALDKNKFKSEEEKIFSAKELEDEERKITLYFQDVIRSITETLETERQDMQDLEAKMLKSHEKDKEELKKYIKLLEARLASNEEIIANLKAEIVRSKNCSKGIFHNLQSYLTDSYYNILCCVYKIKSDSLALVGEIRKVLVERVGDTVMPNNIFRNYSFSWRVWAMLGRK